MRNLNLSVRRAGRDLHAGAVDLSALLPVTRHVPDRPVLAQPRRDPQRRALRRLRAARQHQHAARMAAAGRLPHDPPRPLPERLRHAEPRRHRDPAGLDRLAFDRRSVHLQLHAVADERQRHHPRRAGAPQPAGVPDGLLRPPGGGADHGGRALAAAVLPLAHLPGSPQRLAARLRTTRSACAPRRPRPGTATSSRRKPLPRPPNFDEGNVYDKPQIVADRGRIRGEVFAAVQENYQQELESLQSVDDAVGSVVDALTRSGELGNTLIIYTSDNGFFHGEHRVRSEKILPYEPGLRVPLAMRGPGRAGEQALQADGGQHRPGPDDPRSRQGHTRPGAGRPLAPRDCARSHLRARPRAGDRERPRREQRADVPGTAGTTASSS